MSKRKFSESVAAEAPSNAISPKALRLQRLQLDGLIDQGKTSLFRALRVARGIERQKLGRRQKTARTENAKSEIARLSAEVTALKKLNLTATAEIHLYKTLLKIKPVASAPSFPHHAQVTVEASRKPQETASANVQARLFKSSPVLAAMTGVMKSIRALLGIEELNTGSKKRIRVKDFVAKFPAEDSIAQTASKDDVGPTRIESRKWAGFSRAENKLEDHSIQVEGEGEDEDVDYDTYASRLGSSDSESLHPSHNEQGLSPQKSRDLSITSTSNSNSKEGGEPPTITHNPLNSNPPPKATTFLPSLSYGGYWSGSDSDPAANNNNNDLSAARIEVRKNRMGQQARRALWEKKFGKAANHLKNRPRDRDQGWDARRGASVRDERGMRGRARGGTRGFGVGTRGEMGKGKAGGRGAKSTGANSDPVGTRKQTKQVTDGPLHPSWEAARKAKEQKKAVPFQGKKVVFD